MKSLIAAVAFLLTNSVAFASTVLMGSVTEGPGNAYTYSYTIDNTEGVNEISNLTIYVSSIITMRLPLGFTSPEGWFFTNAFGADETVYQWFTYPTNIYPLPGTNIILQGSPSNPVHPGSMISGFSFWGESDKFAPLFLNKYVMNDGSTGYLVGPDVPSIPLPAALPLFGAGLAGLGFVGWLRRKIK